MAGEVAALTLGAGVLAWTALDPRSGEEARRLRGRADRRTGSEALGGGSAPPGALALGAARTKRGTLPGDTARRPRSRLAPPHARRLTSRPHAGGRAGFHRLFIANRGEVAARIARTCDATGDHAGLRRVRGRSRRALHRGTARRCAWAPRAPRQSYLDACGVVQAAVQARCTALHPGWGFLAENPRFAALCEQHGVTFVGPPAHVMQLMGKKTPAKRAMAAAGLALIPGSDGVLADAERRARGRRRGRLPGAAQGRERRRWPRHARRARAPTRSSGAFERGAGRGARGLRRPARLPREARRGRPPRRDPDPRRPLRQRRPPRRARLHGAAQPPEADRGVALARCSTTTERARTLAAAVRAATSIGYVGAGTMEFLLDDGRHAALHGDEHPPAGRALRHRDAQRARSGRRADPRGRRPAARARAGRRALRGPRHRVPDQRRGSERRVPAGARASSRAGSPPEPASGACASTPTSRAATRCRRTTTALICKVIAHGDDRDAAADRMIAALERAACARACRRPSPCTSPSSRSRGLPRGSDYDTARSPAGRPMPSADTSSWPTFPSCPSAARARSVARRPHLRRAPRARSSELESNAARAPRRGRTPAGATKYVDAGPQEGQAHRPRARRAARRSGHADRSRSAPSSTTARPSATRA